MKQQLVIRKIPLLPVLLAFVIGILLQHFFSFSFGKILLFFIAVFSINVLLFFLPFNFKYKLKSTLGGLLLLSFVALGSLLLWNQNIENDKYFAGNYTNVKAYFVRLEEPLTEKPKSYKSFATIEKILINDKWIKAKGDVFVYFKKDSLSNNLDDGSQLIFVKPLQQIKNAGNPGEFDYAAYCHRKGIYFQQFLSRNDYRIAGTSNPGFWKRFLNKSRQWIIEKIDENISGEQERAVAKALLIGYRNDLDKDMLQAFANAGVIHIIAISGMHLLLIGGIFLWLLSPLKRLKYGNIIHVAIVIFIVWIFTFIAGAVPSVTRAAIMFTVLLGSTFFDRKYVVYNALAFSALLLLITNPYYLWDAGFMLSYAAVLSIALFYRTIFNKIKFSNKILQSLWNLVALSLAAQLITLPFVLYYFHRFPVLFLLGNIVAVPLSAIILYMEIAMLSLAFIPPLASVAGKIVEMLIHIFNAVVQFVGNVSFATIDFANTGIFECILLMLAVIGLYFFIHIKSKNGFLLLVLSLAGCMVIGFVKYHKENYQQKIIVYNIPKHTVIDFVSGKNIMSVSDTLFDINSEEYNYIIKSARTYYGVHRNKNIQDFQQHYPFLNFKNKTIFILSNNTIPQIENASNTDIVIVSKNYYLNFKDLKSKFPHAIFVFTNENSLWKIGKWKTVCDSLHLQSQIVNSRAFILNL